MQRRKSSVAATVLRWWVLVIVGVIMAGMSANGSHAAAQASDFALQVTPSPLIATVRPGVKSSYEVQVRNAGSTTQNLIAKLGSFTVDGTTQQIKLLEQPQPDVASFVSIANPSFTLLPGQMYTLHLNVNTPASAAFTYNFTVNVQRAPQQNTGSNHTTLNGSVVIFALFKVDKPGATAKFKIQTVTTSSHIYQFLPVSFNIQLVSTGNSIVQPSGNVYISRNPTAQKSITVLPLNPRGSYLLPNETRTLTSSWSEGFPFYASDSTAGQPGKRHLLWNWGSAQNFRFGKYYATVIGTYNLGGRDVPVASTVAFWVIPWGLLSVCLVVLLLITVGGISIGMKVFHWYANWRRGKPKKM